MGPTQLNRLADPQDRLQESQKKKTIFPFQNIYKRNCQANRDLLNDRLMVGTVR